jgi:hypothetical protein
MTTDDRTDPAGARREPDDEGAPDPDVLPEDAEARGAQTIPGVTQTGQTTPPISGWGDVPADETPVEDETPVDETPPTD